MPGRKLPVNMGYWTCRIFLNAIVLALALTVLISVETADAVMESKPTRKVTKPDNQRASSRCVPCKVRGITYKGHSRFEFEEDCNRYRCICRCNGSYICPARNTINLCPDGKQHTHSQSSSSSSLSSSPKSSASSSSISSSFDRVSTGSSSLTPRRGTSSSSKPGRGACRNCTVQGKEYKGNSNFSHVDGCIQHNCACRCNGSWSCPRKSAVYICKNGNHSNQKNSTELKVSTEPSEITTEMHHATSESHNGGSRKPITHKCLSCFAGGIERKGNAYFELDETCVRYKYCLCRCNGSWNCPERFTVNTCRENRIQNESKESVRKVDTCYPCNLKNQTFPGNSSFEIRHGCIQYSNCYCRCNGSWVCPDTGASNVCLPKRILSCPGCEVNLRQYPGNSYFSMRQACVKYSNCICNCDGSWVCPISGARNMCGRRVTVTGISSGPGVSRHKHVTSNATVSAPCKRCLAYGKYFKGGSNFDIINQCTSYKNCVCRCDGSWNCNPQFATNLCKRDSSTVPPTSPRSVKRQRCLQCNAKGKIVTGNSYFNLTDGCYQFRNCLCRCDSSWDCPPEHSNDICKTTARLKSRGPFGCLDCAAKGKRVDGGSKFNLVDGCIRYHDCQCNCDGSWKCFGDKAKNICFNNTSSANGCLTCKASDGSIHQPNTPFRFLKDCVEYSCNCFCNGSWDCSGDKSRWVCTDRCAGCDVNGRKIASNTTFAHKTGCLEYTCNCHCNGSWSCPGSTVRNTCPVGLNVNCNKCIVSPNEQYDGESDFVLRRDCLHYKCRCNCDGSYSCPGKDARNVCRGERLGGCKSCVVSDREVFRGDADFSFRKGCINYQCHCNCDGSWNCPAKDARDVCLGEVPGGCRVCRVSDTEVYRANTKFDLRKGCIQYKCQCNCNGGWSCPGKDARDVCKGEVPGGCRSCKISENEYYPGESNFEMVKNCIRYKCRCDCNGSYNCPGKTARHVCRNKASPLIFQCKNCKVSDREMFSGNKTFSLDRGCYRYQCKCNCDGSWTCPHENTQKICIQKLQAPSEFKSSRCRPCNVRNEKIPSESTFQLQRRCYQLECRCRCNGKWSCDSSKRINTCRRNSNKRRKPSIRSQSYTESGHDALSESIVARKHSQNGKSFHETDIRLTQDKITTSTTSSPVRNSNDRNKSDVRTSYARITSVCKQCYVQGKVKRTNELFEIEVGCVKHRYCLCLCSGQYECAEEINLCSGDGKSVMKPHGLSDPNSVTRRQEMSTPVTTHAKDSRQILQNRGNTKYVVNIEKVYKPNIVFTNPPQNSKRPIPLSHAKHSRSSSYSSSVFLSAANNKNRTSPSGSQSSTSSPNVSTSVVSGSRKGSLACTQCLADGKKYSKGTQFDMRRGCVLYKCSCLCSGSYRCLVMSDNACTEDDRKKRCSNCVYNGMVFPGGLSFKVRESCAEKTCQCHCNGTYNCLATSTLKGCGLGIPYGRLTASSGSGFRRTGGRFPFGPGYILRTVNVQQPCATNCHKKKLTGSGVNSVENSRCTSCNLEGKTHAGNSSFSIQKGCIYFDCFCECGGSWSCSGRMAQACYPKPDPGKAPENPRCRNCLIQGTEFPSHSKFLLKQGCFEYKCSCNCDGTWDCPTQQPVNKCSRVPQRNNQDRFEPFTIGDGTSVPTGSNPVKVGSRRGYDRSVEQGCIHCKIDGQMFIPKNDFQIRRGKCHLYNCQCACNGTYTCPPEQVHNICNRQRPDTHADIQADRKPVDMGRSREPEERTGILGCERCFMHGQHVEPLAMFVRQQGCFETLCHCLCNGEPSCPDSASINICELPDTKPMEERPGCKVGRRRHFTRVFALVEDCFQRVCICHDDGTWTCKKSAQDKRVC